MYIYLKKHLWSLLSFFFLFIVTFWNPTCFSLMGFQPYWPIFWLLPWAVSYGTFSGALTGLFIGLILDSINNDLYTQMPSLILCGYWFGRLGSSRKNKLSNLEYGLIAAIGNLIIGLFYFLQIIFNVSSIENYAWLINFGIQNIFAQIFLSGLFAPVLCPWLFYLFRKKLN